MLQYLDRKSVDGIAYNCMNRSTLTIEIFIGPKQLTEHRCTQIVFFLRVNFLFFPKENPIFPIIREININKVKALCFMIYDLCFMLYALCLMLYALFFIWFSVLKAWNISDNNKVNAFSFIYVNLLKVNALSPRKPAEARGFFVDFRCFQTTFFYLCFCFVCYAVQSSSRPYKTLSPFLGGWVGCKSYS
jgi:hypothetical protein